MSKKILIAFLITGMLIIGTGIAGAQSVSVGKSQYDSLLQQLIVLLIQRVQQLEAQLAVLNGSSTTSTAMISPNVSNSIAESTDSVGVIGDATSTQTVSPSLPDYTTPATTTQQAVTSTENTATVSAPPLMVSVAQNSAFSNPTYSRGSTAVELASFIFTASTTPSVSGATLFRVDTPIQNLKVFEGATQLGATRSVTQTGTSYAFSIPSIPDGQSSTEVDVYGDVSSQTATGTYNSVVDFVGFASPGGIVLTSGSVLGQSVTVQ